MPAYPRHLSSLPKFPKWLRLEVDRLIAEGREIPEMVRESSRPPSLEATAFRSMKAHKMHLRVRSAEEHKLTCDSTVAATFLQPERRTLNEEHQSFVAVEYIGFVDEILELNYSGHCVIVLLYSWVKARMGGQNATVKRDEYGFTLAKVPSEERPVGPDLFAFPINV